MKVRFWGTRGSIPSPLGPAEVEEKIYQAILGLPDIDTHDADAVRAFVAGLPPLMRGTVGGNTPCVEIQAGKDTFIIDAGTGLYALGLELMKGACGRGQGKLHLFISHPHWDHIHGFIMFTPAFVPGNRILIYGPHDLKAAFEIQHNEANWPVSLPGMQGNYSGSMQADIEFVRLQARQSLSIGSVDIDLIPNTHPGDSYAYRFKDQHGVLVYASDVEYKELSDASVQPHIEFFRDADVLVFDAQYTLKQAWQRIDWGHSSALIGVDLARIAGVKKLVLFHHDPTYSDADLLGICAKATAYQAQDTSLPTCHVLVAYEGLVLDLDPSDAVGLQLARGGETTILTPSRIFDRRGVDALIQQLSSPAVHQTSSIIDLSRVETLTTASLKSLVTLHQAHPDAPIVLAAPSDNIRQIINLAGYMDYFAMYPSVDIALAAMQALEDLNLPGHMIKDRYKIEGKIGGSGVGTVLKATDTHTDALVTLTVLSPSFSQVTLERFMRQAQQIMGLDHANIVRVIALEQDADQFFIVEEFVDSPTLQFRLSDESSPLADEQIMDIALDITRALEYAHSRGVIHGNLTPRGIFMTADGVRLAGFGLGRLEEGRNLLDAPLLFFDPAYLAPEQILGHALDASTDLYALGVILYQLLIARPPFEGPVRDVLQAHLNQPPLSPRKLNPQISLSLEHLVLKLLAKNPNDRYASANQARRVSSGLSVSGQEVIHRGGRHPLIGREKQLHALYASWKEACAGRGQLVFITGELGVGKTSLALQWVEQSKPPVQLIGHGQEPKGTTAYYLFAEVLQMYFATVPPEFLDEQARQLLSNFAHLIPEIHQMLPDVPQPSQLDPAQDQLRLMSSLTQFIKRATQERPWLIILDDLQWADPNSLEILRYLGRHLPAMALLLVGIYHDVELERDLPLSVALRDLGSYPTCRHLVLERLNETQVAQLLANIWQQLPPPTLVQKIYQHTEGNPFYVEEVAGGLIDDGLVVLQGGQWLFPTLEEVSLPNSVREVVRHRISNLTPATQTLLRQAAILGQTFRFDDLREMSGLSEWQVMEDLDKAMERQLIQETPGSDGLRFRHAEIQQVIYDDLGALRRRLLHRQAGEVLERCVQCSHEHLVEELAYHFVEAGELEKALSYSAQAALRAKVTFANAAALSWYKQALDMLDRLGEDAAPLVRAQRPLLHQSLGEVLLLVGRYDEALEQFALARALLETKMALSVKQSRQLADLCLQTARVHEMRGEYEFALEWLEKGRGYLDESQPTSEIARIYNLLGCVHVRQGNYELAQRQLDHALLLARATHLRQVEADSLRVLGVAYNRQSDYDQSKLYLQQALNIYDEIGDRQGEGAVLNNLGILFCYMGEYDLAGTYLDQALHIRRDIGDRQGESMSLGNLGLILCARGDYPQAKLYYEAALRNYREAGERQLEGVMLNNIGEVLTRLGDYDSAMEYFKQSLRIRREIGDRYGEGVALSNLAWLFHSLGENRVAQEYSQRALRIIRNLDDRRYEGYALTYLGHALAGLAQQGLCDWPEAADAYHQALTVRRELGQLDLAMESLAGLVRVYMAEDDIAQALVEVEEILNYLKGHSLDATDEPVRIYQTCYRVLQANGDSRAGDILAMAYTLLQGRAARIDDEKLRHSFLKNVTVHRELVEEWESQ